MCGIIGYFSKTNNFTPKTFANANNLVKYRGPDDFGYIGIDDNFSTRSFEDEDLSDFNLERPIGALGFRRLSIIDTSKDGHQPMSDSTGNYWIIFNGEIYNYIEIKEELIKKGYKFKSKTDTEVIIYSYIEWGTECLEKFNGMWAFCIYDKNKKILFCARDRFGIKPFYYYSDEKYFIFSSEVKQILLLLNTLKEINKKVVLDYLLLGSYGNETKETFFKNIFKLDASEYVIVDLNKGNKFSYFFKKWYKLNTNTEIYDQSDLKDKIIDLLHNSIMLRLRSDVPVGTCLSGGLDSSGIISFIYKFFPDILDKHKVFTIGSKNPDEDEIPTAKKLSELYNVKNYTEVPDESFLLEDIEKFIWHHDEPLIKASMFGGYHLYKLVKDSGVTVALDGQGVDELMGGYYNQPHYTLLLDLLNTAKVINFLQELKSNKIRYNNDYISIISAMIKYKLTKSNFSEIIKKRVKTENRDTWLSKDFISENIEYSQSLLYKFQNRKNIKSYFKKESYDLIFHTNLPGILRQVDRNSMAFSVEARLPYLDYRLVELFFSVPSDLILRNGMTKYILREAMDSIIPDFIRLDTVKNGFNMPEEYLMQNSLDMITKIIEGYENKNDVFDEKLLKNNLPLVLMNDYSSIVLRTLNYIIWENIFINK